MQTKEALAHAVDLLAVTIREGIPLTPERYDHEARLASVERLRSEIDAENWVDPALLREYTALYLKELDIANSREYFYAKIPVTSRYGAPGAMWAECVMNGNWSVYYRTIDGKHLGVYSNVAEEGPPRYEFQERLPGALAKEVEETIMITRPEDYERKMQILVEKQTVADSRTHAQAIYDSL